MLERSTRWGTQAEGSGKASWRKGQLTQGLADGKESAQCTDKEESVSGRRNTSKSQETRKGMVQLRNQKRFGVARKLSLGLSKHEKKQTPKRKPDGFHSRQKLF